MNATKLATTTAVLTAITSSVAFGQVAPTSPSAQSQSYLPYNYAKYFDEDAAAVAPDAVTDTEDDADADYRNGQSCCEGYCDDCREPACECGGWLQQGITFNPYGPNDRFNGVVNTNDRANDWMMNQFWVYMEREVDASSCAWDWGGRMDIMYGTDAEYLQMNDGWEESWDMNARFYQVATPQMYVELGRNDWTLRVGRFTSPLGLEPITAVDNFFYSRSYNWFPEPNNLFGFMVKRQLTDTFAASAGMHRGSDQFNDTDGKDNLDFVGGVEWQSCDERSWWEAYTILEEKGPRDNTSHFAFIAGTKLANDWEYAMEWYYGTTDTNLNPNVAALRNNSEWYGINQHLYRWVNDCWAYGFRFEWFRDDDGNAIWGFRDGNTATGPFVGDFYELTFAINYTPCEKFVLRPELRWDWYDADQGGGPRPFDDATRNSQFIGSIDAIWMF